MLVMKIDKDLSTKELIEYAKDLSEHLGEKVVILDNKVKEFYRLEEKTIPNYIPMYWPYPHNYFEGYPFTYCDGDRLPDSTGSTDWTNWQITTTSK